MAPNFKLQVLLSLMLGILIILSLGISIYSPNITGFVPIDIYTQNLNLIINTSQNFFLSSDNLEPFIITSFKISGNIKGDGQVKIYIDSGKGQRVLVYDNIKKNSDTKKGFLEITGKVVDDIKSLSKTKKDKWLVIKPIKILLEKESFDELNSDEYLFNGDFSTECKETCFMNMEFSRDIAYRLVFLVQSNTTLKINEIVFTTLEN